MKNLVLFAISANLGLATIAHADGFKCEGSKYGTAIKVYNHTQPTAGTRNVGVIVVSNQSRDAGDQTVATFTDARGIFAQGGTSYLVAIDHRFKTVKKGSELGGMLISDINSIKLDINFNYQSNTPSKSGEVYSALATYTATSGAQTFENLSCTRYLKASN